jgi:hypothetical protein
MNSGPNSSFPRAVSTRQSLSFFVRTSTLSAPQKRSWRSLAIFVLRLEFSVRGATR